MAAQTAKAAHQVCGAEGVSTAAHKAVNEGLPRGGGALRKPITTTTTTTSSQPSADKGSSDRTDCSNQGVKNDQSEA